MIGNSTFCLWYTYEDFGKYFHLEFSLQFIMKIGDLIRRRYIEAMKLVKTNLYTNYATGLLKKSVVDVASIMGTCSRVKNRNLG